ncbi:MAG: PspC domain-containing protein [Candidatus Levyibacteriota bacterium]|jgi:phage shock protein C
MAKKNGIYRKLYRSETNRVIAGVAGGLGEYFEVDPTIIRLLFVLLTVFGGGGILVYIILWILIPCESCINKNSEDTIKQNAKELKTKAKTFAQEFKGMSMEDHPRNWLGFLIIILGLLFLFDNLGFLQFHLFWPLLLVALGFFLLFKNK